MTVGLLVLMLVVVQARPAGATFPGPNGKIAYAADDGGSGGIGSEIYTINARGGGVSPESPITIPQTPVLPGGVAPSGSSPPDPKH